MLESKRSEVAPLRDVCLSVYPSVCLLPGSDGAALIQDQLFRSPREGVQTLIEIHFLIGCFFFSSAHPETRLVNVLGGCRLLDCRGRGVAIHLRFIFFLVKNFDIDMLHCIDVGQQNE